MTMLGKIINAIFTLVYKAVRRASGENPNG